MQLKEEKKMRLNKILAATALLVAVSVALGTNPWFLIVIYWVLVATKWLGVK